MLLIAITAATLVTLEGGADDDRALTTAHEGLGVASSRTGTLGSTPRPPGGSRLYADNDAPEYDSGAMRPPDTATEAGEGGSGDERPVDGSLLPTVQAVREPSVESGGTVGPDKAEDVGHDTPPSPTVLPEPAPTSASATEAVPPDAPRPVGDEAFAAGYLEAGGPPDLLPHFLANVLPCESVGPPYSYINWDVPPGLHVTAAQFSWDTYAKVVAHLAALGVVMEPNNPYHVGLGVGWWASITDPGTQWPICFWKGITW